jgi:uncharacterized protein (DUF362 family)
MKNLSRREFIKAGVTGSAALSATSSSVLAEEKPKTDIWVFEGKDNQALMAACMETFFKNGGFGPDAKKVALKVNAAWERTPEQGANTAPELIDVFLEKAIASGVSVVMPEHPFHRTALSELAL